jgi:hypothetical protein
MKKLVGATALCSSLNKTQSYIPFLIYASRTIGLTAPFGSKAVGECFKSSQDQEAAEIRIAWGKEVYFGDYGFF